MHIIRWSLFGTKPNINVGYITSTAGNVMYDGSGLDYETTPLYHLQVSVTAGVDTVGPLSLYVNVTDVNEAPYWQSDPYITGYVFIHRYTTISYNYV